VISLGIDAALRHGAAVPAIPVRDTLKRVGADGATVVGTVDRTNLWAAQTPQVFRSERLHAAYAALGERAPEFTDDAGIVEAAGFPVVVFSGDQSMIKITHGDDLAVVEALAHSRSQIRCASSADALPVRVGTGYDIHRLEAGNALILGGVVVPHDVGCVGYSDGDALAHAVIDALLGASSLGDIGRHFPPSDDRFKGADSIDLVRMAVSHVRGAGFEPVCVDATVVLEQPRLAPYVDEMAGRIARAVGIEQGAVSVKAKSNEGLDSIGRGEAVAVHAVATVRAVPDVV
jgi:2-C-methyl-D-erythritol 2,4-cyclodiphosphate synthase